MNPKDFTEMQVHKLVMDPNTNSPIVILHDKASGVLMPIWIGIFEAHSIAMKLENQSAPRPMTHDLLSETFATLKVLVNRVEVTDLLDGTYFARIYFELDAKEHSLDSRPSDAIALALRTNTPIYVANAVLAQSKIVPDLIEDADADGETEPASGTEGPLGGVGTIESEDDALRLLRALRPPKDPRKLN